MKKVKGRGGRPDRVELIVNIDLVSRSMRNPNDNGLKDLKARNIFRANTA